MDDDQYLLATDLELVDMVLNMLSEKRASEITIKIPARGFVEVNIKQVAKGKAVKDLLYFVLKNVETIDRNVPEGD